MTAGFDPETGKLISIRMKGDPLKTEYIGNRKNISYPSIREANQWMGDVRFRIWDENAEGWREERTADSEDNRIVSVEEDKVRVSWLEPSEKTERNPYPEYGTDISDERRWASLGPYSEKSFGSGNRSRGDFPCISYKYRLYRHF